MWRIVRRVLALIGLLIAVTGFVGFGAAAVGVWKLKAEANRRADSLALQAHTAVNAADHAVSFVSGVVDQGERDLQDVREKAKKEEPQPPVNPFVRLSARQASEKLAGSVERANAAVVAASEAVEVAKTALKLFESDEEVKSWFPVPPEQISQTKTDLTTATHELRTVRTILGIPIADGAMPTTEQLLTVEAALRQAREFIERLKHAVNSTRARVTETKRTVDLWVLRVAIGVTFVGVLGAAGQFFMARFFWRVLRGKPA
jgi:hypothetical protein